MRISEAFCNWTVLIISVQRHVTAARYYQITL